MLRRLIPTLKSVVGQKYFQEWDGEDRFKEAGNRRQMSGTVGGKKEEERISG